MVENVLSKNDDWELADANERVKDLKSDKSLTISVMPGEIQTNGFFVALFRRK